MMRMLLAIVATLAALAPAAPAKAAKASVKAPAKAAVVRMSATGSDTFAMYELGEDSEQEHMHHLTEPGRMTRINAIDEGSFVVRSVDMRFRVKITVNTNKDEKTKKTFPWELTFKNLMMEDEYQFELKHSNSGYVWVLPGTKVTHMTDHGHMFDLRNKTHAVVATVMIEDPKLEL